MWSRRRDYQIRMRMGKIGGLIVPGDTWWDQQGMGSNYNSDSECQLITGNNAKSPSSMSNELMVHKV
jgi:hypothetical protein